MANESGEVRGEGYMEAPKATAGHKKNCRRKQSPQCRAKISAAAAERYDKRVAALEIAQEKPCSNCGVVKNLSEFDRPKRKNGSGYSAWCKTCNLEKHEEKRLKEFNITPDERVRILDSQNHRCAICQRPESDFQNRLAVDHDHKTGLVRGCLCWFCNKLVAIAQDNAERLLLAGIYLLRPPAV